MAHQEMRHCSRIITTIMIVMVMDMVPKSDAKVAENGSSVEEEGNATTTTNNTPNADADAVLQPFSSSTFAKPTVLHMKHFLTDLRNQDIPLITEFPRWVQVNLSDVGHDHLNPSGFINVGCYRELTGFMDDQLYNRTFRFVLQKKFEGINILCMLRFPTGLRVRYRFEFSDGNSYAFFALGHNKNLTVATSRLISKFERNNAPFQWWKGVIFVPCRYSTLVFHPHAAGEIFEFRIIDHPRQFIDKCSELEKEFY